jgi:hypothetical protein
LDIAIAELTGFKLAIILALFGCIASEKATMLGYLFRFKNNILLSLGADKMELLSPPNLALIEVKS